MVHGHVFEIKEADYHTTCCCCFKTRVARGGFGRTKADLAHKTQLEPRHNVAFLTSVDSDEPVQPPFKLINSRRCSVSSLTLIEYSSD